MRSEAKTTHLEVLHQLHALRAGCCVSLRLNDLRDLVEVTFTVN
jgi:hypothetical protein